MMKKFLQKGKKGKKEKENNSEAKESNANTPQTNKDGVVGKPTIKDFLNEDAVKARKGMEEQDLLWYHGNISRNLAESRLKQAGNQPGLFLIRKSNFHSGDFVLSFVHEESIFSHYAINQKADWRYSLRGEEPIEGLDVLVNHYVNNDHSLPFRLTRPLLGEPPPSLALKTGVSNILHRAIQKGDIHFALAILDHDWCPDVDSKDCKGNSTVHLAVAEKQRAVVLRLIELNACLTVLDSDGFTPLHRACQNDASDIVELMLADGADAEYRHRGTENVPLHEAAAFGNSNCVKILLSHGATAWTRNGRSKTPYELAVKFGHNECAKIFDTHKALPAKSCQKDWFHEHLKRQEAAELMEKHNFLDGLFLVRKSSRNAANFVLSLSFNKAVRNYEITNEGSVAYHIDNGPLLSTLEHVVDYYGGHSDGIKCRLTMYITPDEEVRPLLLGDDATDGYESSQVIYNIHENGGHMYMEAKEVFRRGSMPSEAPPPPPPIQPKPPKSLFEGKGKHPLILEPSSIEMGFELGQGEYGSVLRGVWTSKDGKEIDVAIKTMNEQYMENGKKQFLQEAQVMVKLDHPCIVSLIGVSEGPPLMLVQELVALGALLDFLLDYPSRITTTDLALWAAQVACGMLYLEKQGFVHRDLATRNILLAGKQQAKVGDFGLSRAVEGMDDCYRASQGGRWPVKWYAPESIMYGQFSHASDVWSFGVTLWEMYTYGDQPYDDMKGAEVIAFLENKGRLRKPEECPKEIYDIMLDCWAKEAEDRRTFKWLLDFFNRSLEKSNLMHVTSGLVEASSC